jgi:thiol-disulfide isomerase/thioredoxin
MRGLTRFLAVAALALLAACGEEKQQAAAEPNPLDGMVFATLDGVREPLEAFRGKTVVLNVWATWCGPCRREMAGLQKLADRLDPARYVVLGLSIDTNPALVREYLRGKDLRFARHIDPDGAISARIDAVPTTIIISPEGKLLWVEVGERAWGEDNIPKWLEGLS